MPGRKNTKKSARTEVPTEIPLEGPAFPLETGPMEREDVHIPREDAVMSDADEVPAPTETTPTPPPTRSETTPARTPAAPPPAPVINKTQSELNVEDSLFTSFVNGAKSREIEVAFAFDTTGSMNAYLAEVRKKLKETCTKLTTDIPNIKIAIMAIGDYCDFNNYVVKHQDLISDTTRLVNWVENVAQTGGGDAPEAYELALREAKKLTWSPLPTVNKAFVIIGDSAPHAPSYTTEKIYWRDEVADLVKQGVKIYGVHCNPNNKDSLPFYEEVAEMSGGICLSLKHLQLITDMFKAVCYREFGAEHLETYRAEVVEGGRMDEKMEDLFAQLKQGPNAKTKLGERSTEAWYLSKYDKGVTPLYAWNPSTNNWENYKPSLGGSYGVTTAAPKKRKDEPEPEASSSKSPAKKVKKSPKKPAAKKTEKKKTTEKKVDKKESPKKKGAKKAKKVEEDEDEDEEEEEAPKKTIAKGSSVIVGTGEWKRDRFGRMASLHDA